MDPSKITDSGIEAGLYEMNLEHLIVSKSKEAIEYSSSCL
jgi:hypothetical protein